MSLYLEFAQIGALSIRNDKQPALTLSRADENAAPFIPVDKPLKSQQPEDAIHKGGNFR